MYNTRTTDPEYRYIEKGKKLNILIVDDDENSRELLKDIIKTRNHKVTTLDEGMKCVNRCSENKFDIILMDYHINDLNGELNGTDVVSMVKECFNIDTIVYAYTGDNSNKAINDFKINNMRGALIKPVDPRLIYDFLRIIELDPDNNNKLSRLARKNKNFLYFGKK